LLEINTIQAPMNRSLSCQDRANHLDSEDAKRSSLVQDSSLL
jgi:hypothetical protein